MSPGDPRHGTAAGYPAHKKAGVPPCGPCEVVAARNRKWNRYLCAIGRPTFVDKTGTVRRLRALRAIGWTICDIARETGISEKTLRNPGHRGRFVTRGLADAVADVYDRWSMTVPAGGYHDRGRRFADRQGWASPLAWDDDTIDDPTAVPVVGRTRDRGVDDVVVDQVLAGAVIPTTTAERHAIMRRWKAAGRSEKSLCARMGWKDSRYGRTDREAGAA